MLDRFQKKHLIVPGEKPDSKLLERFESLLPQYLISIWSEFGFFTTKDSFFFLTNPDDFEFMYEQKILNRDQIVFGRTSFAELFIWNKDHRLDYLVNYGTLFGSKSPGSEDLEIFFESRLYRDEALDTFNQKEHKKAVKNLGILESDECFAFVPAFALGGSARTSEIEKVKLREHLLFLSQLTGKPQSVNSNFSTGTLDNLIDAYDRENP
jgi:hypothetical protein